jgi:signal transduction histidine kinase
VRAETDPDVRGSLVDARRVLATRQGDRSVHDGIAQAAVPLHFEARPAVLALRRPLDDVSRTYAVVADAFAGAALAGLALALIGGFALSGRMLRRLRALSDAMRAADPIPPARVDKARDELGELARSFAGLQQRLAQQEDARRMFVATASHELRTPLAS